MSYDVYLRNPVRDCPTCGRRNAEPECQNPTYNLTPIFDFALTGELLPNPTVSKGAVVIWAADRPRGLWLLSGRTGADTIAQLKAACERIEDPERAAAFRALEPENRWGTLEDARSVMRDLSKAAIEYPRHVWEVH